VTIDFRWVAEGVTVTCLVIAVTPELFSEDDGVEISPGIEEDMELAPSEESLTPAGGKSPLLVGAR